MSPPVPTGPQPPSAVPPHDANAETAALYAPHFRDGRFFNPWGRLAVRPRDVLRWWWQRPWRRPPDVPAPRVPNDGSSLGQRHDGLAATWVGHATFALHHEHAVLLTDPHWSNRALVPRRHVPPGIPIAAVPPSPLVLLSHNHYDHLDRWTVRHLPADARWLVPLGLGATLRRMGAAHVRELDWWQEAVDGPFRLTCLPAQHWSNRATVPRNASLWCSWMIEVAGRRVYFAGDSGWFAGFAEYGRRFGPVDAAMLPIGAYEPRWFMRYQHVNPAEALAAAQALLARELVGMHWGTFVLTDEPLDEPPRALARAVAAAGDAAPAVRLPAVGERWEIAPP
ncbi:MAG TPA: MBL fold metallo-hydrolase [Thermoanaerobaculia bacterium]|nr:MBL fold metallo-hydrolase [Thermoanaerobaculia bacterium]